MGGVSVILTLHRFETSITATAEPSLEGVHCRTRPSPPVGAARDREQAIQPQSPAHGNAGGVFLAKWVEGCGAIVPDANSWRGWSLRLGTTRYRPELTRFRPRLT